MEKENLITVVDFCRYYKVDLSFVQTLEQRGLIETVRAEQAVFVQVDHLASLERLIRIHHDLDIPAENLDVISQLIVELESLHQEIRSLEQRLGFYEQFENSTE
ncbi:MAG TPA: chaperone modulator CbpM [Puia sp.]|nr:chaperone modulator CbpM [Puia sp.]